MNQLDFKKIELIVRNGNCLIGTWKKSTNPEIKQAIQNLKDLTNNLPEEIDMKTRLYCFLNDIKYLPKCKLENCNNYINYYSGRLTQYCSDKHRRIGSPFQHIQKHSEETKKKLSEKGLIHNKGEKNPMFGRKQSEHCKQKNREIQSGKIRTQKWIDDWKEKMKKGAKERGEKISKTFRKKQIEHPELIQEWFEKQCCTKDKNGTHNASKAENALYEILKIIYPNTRRNYKKDKRYPFKCDFYIPELDLFIEYNEYWHHYIEIYNENNENHKRLIDGWIKKIEEKRIENPTDKNQYEVALKVFTKSDPQKLKIAIENHLNYLILWNWKDVEKFLKNELYIEFKYDVCLKELDQIKNIQSSYDKGNEWNKIILTYQQHFFEKEKELWKNNLDIRAKLLNNRCKFLNKKINEITDYELLRGFKISGRYYGFSQHSPFWIKKFIEDYNIKSIYDPCGGWGHRLLGAQSISYIYNDSDTRSYEGIKNIIKDFDIKDKIVYNNDCAKFTPNEEYECVFTCPPYFNIEKYNNKIFENGYIEWLNTFWYNTIRCSLKESVRYFCFIINERYKKDMKNICLKEEFMLQYVEEIKLGNNKRSLYSKEKNWEYLVIFRRK